MVAWANTLPEIAVVRAGDELEDCSNTPTGLTHVLQLTGTNIHDDGDPEPRVCEIGNAAVTSDAQPSATERRFQVVAASDFASGPPLEWLVRSVLPRAEVAVIFGESGSGKSFLTLDLCCAISRGIAWRERRVARGGVVYVVAEGARGFKKRLRAYAHEHKVEQSELPAIIADAPDLRDPKEAAQLIASILAWSKAHGAIDVVIIDTLSATLPGGNENSGEDMGLVLSHCKFLHKQTGALVVLIHHSGKDATRGARGWSGLRAAADAEIEILRNGDYRTANVTKMKDGSDGETFAFKLKVIPLGEDADGEEESSCVIEHVEAPPEARGSTKQKPSGARQSQMFEVLRTMAPNGTVNYEDLVNGYVAKMPKGDGKDNRKRDAKAALQDLIGKKLAYMHGEDRVSLTSLVTAGTNEDWLK
jgi:hypothetical protein